MFDRNCEGFQSSKAPMDGRRISSVSNGIYYYNKPVKRTIWIIPCTYLHKSEEFMACLFNLFLVSMDTFLKGRRRVSLRLGFSSHPETKQTSLPLLDSRSGIARLPNSLSEFNPYTTTSFQILPRTQQIGNWSALFWTERLPHHLHSKEVHLMMPNWHRG